MKQLLLIFCTISATLADKPSAGYGAPIATAGYGAPQRPQVKYGGPIVYSAEKPPIIHFPPPPAQVCCANAFEMMIWPNSRLLLDCFKLWTRRRQRWKGPICEICSSSPS